MGRGPLGQSMTTGRCYWQEVSQVTALLPRHRFSPEEVPGLVHVELSTATLLVDTEALVVTFLLQPCAGHC